MTNFPHPPTSTHSAASEVAIRHVKAIAELKAYQNDREEALTPGTVASLNDWTGWGPLTQALESRPTGVWAEIGDQLETAIGPKGIKSAQASLFASFYTPVGVAEAMWSVLLAAGFDGGRVLDLGCGSGKLLSGCPIPDKVSYSGIEAEPVSADIARALHPSADIMTAELQNVRLPEARFDAVISNFPFGDFHVYDAAECCGYPSLHAFFMSRALHAVRPGGYLVVIVPRYVLDSPKFATTLRLADLVGAVRLPSGTFGGTDVVADVLALRRREVPLTGDLDWPQVSVGWDRQVSVCRYFVDCGFSMDTSGLVAGDMRPVTRQYPTVEVIGGDREIERAFAQLRRLAERSPMAPRPDAFADAAMLSAPTTDDDGRLVGTFFESGGSMFRLGEDGPEPVRTNKELRALVRMRDKGVELIEADADHSLTDAEIAPLRSELLALYRGYVEQFGPLSRAERREGDIDPETGEPKITIRRPSMGGFRKDPRSWAVMALEEHDPDTGKSKPAPILLRRVHRHVELPTRAETVDEALAASMTRKGRVDVPLIASLLDTSEQEALSLMSERVFRDPAQGGRLVRARDYLSGDVATRLEVARRHLPTDPLMIDNVLALRAVQPDPLGRDDIRVSIGAPYLHATDVKAFATEELGARYCTIRAVPSTGEWDVDASQFHSAPAAFQTARMDASEIFKHALNSTPPVVYDSVYDPVTRQDKRVKNGEETSRAVAAVEAMSARFSVWAWEDDDRAQRIVDRYNTLYNRWVKRAPDGSWLDFPELADGVTMWKHQRDFVDHALATPRAAAFHSVGAGKTLSMLALAVALKRFGLAHKPMITVPKNVLEQVAREAQQWFPSARFLVAGEGDTSGPARRLFAARCASGEHTAVIVSHEMLGSFAPSPADEARYLDGELDAVITSLHSDPSGGGNDRSGHNARRLAKERARITERLRELRAIKFDPDQIGFGHLGVDYLCVDEVHNFRRFPIATRLGGFPGGSSKRAVDLMIKIEALAARRPGLPVCSLFTGTPWGNTLAETYVWQRFATPETLRTARVMPFDAWAKVFVRYETRIEITPDGSGFASKSRPAVIQNLPEMRTTLEQFADLLPASELGLERPDARREVVELERPQPVREYMDRLVLRAEEVHRRAVAPEVDNMLKICTDGRRVALDPLLVGISSPSVKVEAVADRAARIYHDNKHRQIDPGSDVPGALQLVLCDIGTPSDRNDAQTYGRIRRALVKRGVPVGMVRFVQDAKSDRARAALFADCRAGRVAVLIGSTPTVGVGTNVQRRLAALHHLDAPWRPSDVEQREGRILRPGNLLTNVDIITYVVSGSFDAFMWETLTRKARFVSQLYTTDRAEREIDDLSDGVMGFAQIRAAASGNPLLLEQAQAAADVKKLLLERSGHTAVVNKMRKQADLLESLACEEDRQVEVLTGRAKIERTPTMEEVEEAVAAMLEESWNTHELPGGHLALKWDDYSGTALVRAPGPLKVNSVRLTNGQLGKGAKACARAVRPAVAQVVEDVLAGCPNRRAKAAQLREERAKVLETMATARFEKEPQLAAAQARHASLTEQIAEWTDQANSAVGA